MNKLCTSCNTVKSFLEFRYNKCNQCRESGLVSEDPIIRKKEANRAYYKKKSILSPETYYTKKIKKIV